MDMMDAHGTSVALEQLVFRARDAPESVVAGRRGPSDPSINTLKRRLSALARTNRIQVIVTITDDDQLSLRHLRTPPPIDKVAQAMNQPTGV